MNKKSELKKYTVAISKTMVDSGSELSDNFYHNCLFCEKLVRVAPDNFRSCLSLGRGRFYCPFCLRHGFNYKSSRNVLILSFRSIIGQYYQSNFLVRKEMWVSEIETLIKRHKQTGLHCPILSYDEDTYLWFADFNKVGNDKNKAPVQEVVTSIKSILEEFQIREKHGDQVFNGVWKKYQKSIMLFYEKRQRPKGKKMLIPTMKGVIHGDKGFFENTREFIPTCLQIK